MYLDGLGLTKRRAVFQAKLLLKPMLLPHGGWPMAAGPVSRLAPPSPGIKQGCGSNHTAPSTSVQLKIVLNPRGPGWVSKLLQLYGFIIQTSN